jgi:EAL domain-containing protein (putative c-di-GMP-specific phosphodiesterase class I)
MPSTGAPGILNSFHEMGVKVSIDDLGTGLLVACLPATPADRRDQGRQVVRHESHQASGNEVIVRSTVDLAHNLGRRVVGEGVED